MRALCVVVLSACSTGTGPATMAVGPAGGQVSMGDSASVVIPQGALSVSTPVSVSVSTAPAPNDTVAVSTPFLFGPEGTQFAQPVTITLAYDATLLPASAPERPRALPSPASAGRRRDEVSRTRCQRTRQGALIRPVSPWPWRHALTSKRSTTEQTSRSARGACAAVEPANSTAVNTRCSGVDHCRRPVTKSRSGP